MYLDGITLFEQNDMGEKSIEIGQEALGKPAERDDADETWFHGFTDQDVKLPMKKSKHLSNLIKEIVTELDREKPETLSKEFTRYDTNTDVYESGECLYIEIHLETTSYLLWEIY